MPVSAAMSRCDQSGTDVRIQTGHRRGDPYRRDGVAEIVLAVAERALAVFPRLAPVNRGQRRRARRSVRPVDTANAARCSKRVPVRRVVEQAGVRDDVGFGAGGDSRWTD